ncbi:hypothetical protein EN802_24190 [bacterium M00.F.Ca.ET.159.01.1.1]|nr:hypothetical protein EN802_24190 [bacterium M00.F.Ca.ET.159.01.1.1]TGT81205.1 hypothetical protein EN800_23530 [bacterium M00.F.Ca.ET.157.01.1.1]
MSIFNRAKLPGVTPFSPGFDTELASPAASVPFMNGMRGSRPLSKGVVMGSFMKRMSRRAIVQALMALPALSLFRNQPAVAEPDEIVEVNGWILRRSDLA